MFAVTHRYHGTPLLTMVTTSDSEHVRCNMLPWFSQAYHGNTRDSEPFAVTYVTMVSCSPAAGVGSRNHQLCVTANDHLITILGVEHLG